MRKLSVEQTNRYVPLAVAYLLGVMTFWGGFAILGSTPNVDPMVAEQASDASPPASVSFYDIDDSDLPPHVETDTETIRQNLREAAKTGDAATVNMLIAQNADVNAPDDQGRTALFLAASEGKTDVVRTLIDAGADTDATTQEGQTPLMAAAIKGNKETIEVLIEHDANVRMKSGAGSTAQDLAIQYKHDGVARLIADEIDRQNRERLMVTRAQFLLAKLGYRPGGIDGYLGPRTRGAIQRFQKRNELNPDGRVTDQLIEALNSDKSVAAPRKVVVATSKSKPPAAQEGTDDQANASKRAFQRASITGPATSEDGWKTSGDSGKQKDKDEGGFFSWLSRQFSDDPPSKN